MKRLSFGRAAFSYRLEAGTTLVEVQANQFGSPSVGQWYFVCGGYDGTNTWISINAGVREQAAFSGSIFDGSVDLRLGSSANAANPNYLSGTLDEAILYKRSLTSNELTWLYNNGMGRSYAEVSPPPRATQSVTTITYDQAGCKTSMSDVRLPCQMPIWGIGVMDTMPLEI